MPFRRVTPLLLFLLTGCGSETTDPPEISAFRGPSVASMTEGDSGRIASADFYVDAKGRVWVDRNASYIPRGSTKLDAVTIRNSAWVGRIRDRLQVGFDLTDPGHLAPRSAPRIGHWLQAHCPEVVVSRIRAGDNQAASR